MKRFLLLLALATPGLAQGQVAYVVQGIATSRGVPLAGVNVFDLETLEGGITRDDGRFTVTLAGSNRVRARFAVRRIGYAPMDTTIALPATDTLRLELRELAALMPITVLAGRYTATAERTATLTPVEVASTPGSNADITGAIKTLPGVQNVDEGTGLFVRGGDFTETRIFVDGAPLFTAYQFEAPTGSVAGAINPFLTSAITFSSGGFGAQWGNALSGVVALTTQAPPQRSYVNVNASILGATLGAGLALPHNLGFAVTAGAADLGAMLELNGNPRRYAPAPHSRTASALAGWAYRRTGSVKLFGLLQRNGLGVHIEDPAFSTTFHSDRTSDILVASWRDSLGALRPFASASTSGFSREESKGAYDQRTSLRSTHLRVELPFVFNERLTLTAGGDVERLAAVFTGAFPANAYDPTPGAPTSLSSLDASAIRGAAFASLDTRPSASTQLIVGARANRSGFATDRTIDPRASFAWMPRDLLTFTAAVGAYHQVADPAFLDRLQGADRLPELRAEMAIAGVQFGEGTKLVRLEAWTKHYAELVGLARSYATVAHLSGDAHGADLFARTIGPGGVNLRLTYSGSVSRRTDPNTRLAAPAAFDVTHSVTAVAQKDWTSGWSAGAAVKLASGRPFTDVVGADPVSNSDLFVPRFGAPNAERLPDFSRTDISISKARPFGANRFAVAFIGINNVFNQRNTFGYTWSHDYTQRIAIRSAVNRTFFIGANLALLDPL